jgi:hypothetical protein
VKLASPAMPAVTVRMRKLLLVLVMTASTLVGVTCAGITLPDGLGEEDAQGVTDAYGQAAMLPCTVPIIGNRAVVTAEGSVRGVANGRRIRGRLWIGIDILSGSLRLESVYAAPSEFVFVANDAFKGRTTQATLRRPWCSLAANGLFKNPRGDYSRLYSDSRSQRRNSCGCSPGARHGAGQWLAENSATHS